MNVNQRKTTDFQYIILKLPTPSTSSLGEAPEAVPSFLLLFHSSERTDTSGETGAAACAIITWPTIDTLHYAVNWAFTPLPLLSRTLSLSLSVIIESAQPILLQSRSTTKSCTLCGYLLLPFPLCFFVLCSWNGLIFCYFFYVFCPSKY